MSTLRNRHNIPRVEIGGKEVRVSGLSIDPGNNIRVNGYNDLLVHEIRPSIRLEGCDISDYSMHETNHVRVVFPARKRWKFPEERFVSYDESDEDWCRPLNIGREVEFKPVIEMQKAFVESADYDWVRFVGMTQQKKIDIKV